VLTVHPGRTWLHWPWLIAVTAAAVVAPVGVLVLGVLWISTVRAVEWSRIGRARRAWQAAATGDPRPSAAGAVVAYPVRWAGSGVVSSLAVLPLAVAVLLAVWARQAVPGTFEGVGTVTFAAICSFAVAAGIWWGPGGAALRRGTRFVTSPVTRTPAGRTVWLGAAGLVVVASAVTVTEGGAAPQWTPDWQAPSWMGPVLPGG
jgi:hypothetical protein